MNFRPDALTFSEHGAARHNRAALSILPAIEKATVGLPPERAGVRLRGIPALADLLAPEGIVAKIAGGHLGKSAHPVRAILFDKTRATNWALGWHQDRTIVVRSRHGAIGFGPWTVKSGMIHVEPPFDLLAGMATLRIHIDPAPQDNAPLLIAPGSHALGRIPETEVEAVVAQCGTATCLAQRGDIWAYSTPILHASAASNGARRRVLQVDYAATDLPVPLEWRGV